MSLPQYVSLELEGQIGRARSRQCCVGRVVKLWMLAKVAIQEFGRAGSYYSGWADRDGKGVESLHCRYEVL